MVKFEGFFEIVHWLGVGGHIMTPVQNYVGFLYNLIYGCDEFQVFLEPQIALNSWSSMHAHHQKMLGDV